MEKLFINEEKSFIGSARKYKINLRTRGITPAYVFQVINAAAIVMLLRFLTN